MKKEIKFRVWDKQARRMAQVTMIDYFHEGDIKIIVADYLDPEIEDPLCRNCNSKKWKHIYENPELITNSHE